MRFLVSVFLLCFLGILPASTYSQSRKDPQQEAVKIQKKRAKTANREAKKAKRYKKRQAKIPEFKKSTNMQDPKTRRRMKKNMRQARRDAHRKSMRNRPTGRSRRY